MFEVVAFYFFAATSIACFGISVFSKNILYSMSALAGGMIFISGFFFLLGAEFLGVVQIIVYTGAVMVLYAFSMMFFDVSKDVVENRSKAANRLIYTLSVLSALILVLIFSAPIISSNLDAQYPIVENVGNVEIVGILLFTKYLIVFELAAVMLLVAMVSAIVLAHKDMDRGDSDDNA
ncbi:NADH-quinone oxidoreductase subunit J [Campylobacter sp. RM16187]|uniref:NADH-quinone oxidoreductase subunit J n=1 Tax=Campylobacter sp. RM16187 TaxID=1660063 RepID=UPI0021B62D0E|nr:NADH-quinone oxidoreductase subunit J [Campylobacter sp. RM16187]QKG29630.1 NADH:quinone oxidoreductase I, membrane subunit J [Campylobacter sp. RM16187]